MPTSARKPGKSPRNADLAAIHIGVKQLGLDDETYRDMLWSIGRVRSSADLDHAGRQRVLAHLRSRGFVSGRARPTDPQSVKLLALWQDLHRAGLVCDPSERALVHFVTRQTGVESITWLSSAQASRVIEALKSWLARAK